MARYIDADAMIKRLTRMWESRQLTNTKYKCFTEMLTAEPTADVIEVKHGKWIKIGDHAYRCSVCNDVSCCMGDYCPDCGAEMRKEGGTE